MIGPTCPRCDRIHGAGDVATVGSRFSSAPVSFRAPGGPVRATRAEAIADLCADTG